MELEVIEDHLVREGLSETSDDCGDFLLADGVDTPDVEARCYLSANVPGSDHSMILHPKFDCYGPLAV